MEELLEYFELFKISEKSRLATYTSWPYDKDSPCNVEKLVEAGFYLSGKETVTCFACFKKLDGWISTDDPWIEHKKCSPKCYFLKLEKHTDKSFN